MTNDPYMLYRQTNKQTDKNKQTNKNKEVPTPPTQLIRVILLGGGGGVGF
jgi:hypothetical protein